MSFPAPLHDDKSEHEALRPDDWRKLLPTSVAKEVEQFARDTNTSPEVVIREAIRSYLGCC